MTAEVSNGLSCPLPDALDEREVGGKAFNLARLIALGAEVPDGVVLTRAAFEAFVAHAGVDGPLDHLGTAEASLEAIERVAKRVRAVVMTASFPRDVDETLQQMAARWVSVGPVAVRSSAIGEDGDSASFAGQFDSVLGVRSLDDLHDAIRRCFASYWSARAIWYRRAHSISGKGMAVVIQRQLEPVAAGVLFTRNPDPSARARDTLAIEYCEGLAEGLVAGRVEPGSLVLSRGALAVVSETTSGNAEGERARGVVRRGARELVQIALQVERQFGAAQDIEWAIDANGKVWLVQARPITSGSAGSAGFHLRGQGPLRWTRRSSRTSSERRRAAGSPRAASARPDVVWTNANVSENFPQPISPLLYSIASLGYYHYFRNLGLAFGISRRRLRAMELPLRGVIGVHGARMYYNLTHVHAILRMAPFGERLAYAFNGFVGAEEIAASPAGSAGWRDRRSRILQSLELARIAVATLWQYARFEGRLREFERTADAFAARTEREALQTHSLAKLGGLLADFVDIRCHRWKNASLADTAAMVTYELLKRTLGAVGVTEATLTRLLRALPNMPSSLPPRRLWALSRIIREQPDLRTLFERGDARAILDALDCDARFAAFRESFQAYLDTWGFRSSLELMLTFPALDERPEPVVDLLKQYASDSGESPESTLARQAEDRRREERLVLWTMLRRRPHLAVPLWVLIAWTQRSVVARERARLKQALLYTRCRRVALAIGDRLVERQQVESRDDAFMLTWAELDEIASGRAMFPTGIAELVRFRRRQHAVHGAMNPPDTLRLHESEAFDGPAHASSGRGQCERSSESVLEGASACGGLVTARAAVLADVTEAARLQRGDVLVTRQTDPGWAPVFCLVSGLVIERGGMLSHGAIIAREFGLPCVVGVKGATTRIPHGATVTVDGNGGRCVIEVAA